MVFIEEFTECATFILVFLCISFVTALAWRSTYVNSGQVHTTTFFLVEQGPISSRFPLNSNASQPPDLRMNSRTTQVNTEENNSQQCTSATLDSTPETPTTELNDQHQRENNENSQDELLPNVECETNSDMIVNNTNVNTENDSEDEASESIEETKNVTNKAADVKSSDKESIEVRLKFLDDTQRLVRSSLSDDIASFKSANFASELSSNSVVRLIFNGRLLNEDTWTLRQYGFFDKCVVHCHISRQPASSPDQRAQSSTQRNTSLDLSGLLNPLLLGIMIFLWYLRYQYSYIFNTSATIFLTVLTALLLIFQYALVISFNISFSFETVDANQTPSHRFNINRVENINTESSSSNAPLSQNRSLPSTNETVSSSCRSRSLIESTNVLRHRTPENTTQDSQVVNCNENSS